MQPVYDILYGDTRRLRTLYAQIFGGRLISLSERSSDSIGRNSSAGLGAGIQAGVGTEKSTTSEILKTYDPEDLITLDVLTALASSGGITDLRTAQPVSTGSVIRAEGTLFLADKSLVESSLEIVAANTSTNKQAQREAKAMRQVLSKMHFPSVYFLQNNVEKICGTLKDEGLGDLTGGYYLQHGQSGIPNVILIGVAESAPSSSTETGDTLPNIAREYGKALQTFMFPQGSKIVTPLALLREINPPVITSGAKT